jgi:hypothetical protein
MDGRVRDHAETLVDWSARIADGDDVVVRVDNGAHDGPAGWSVLAGRSPGGSMAGPDGVWTPDFSPKRFATPL